MVGIGGPAAQDGPLEEMSEDKLIETVEALGLGADEEDDDLGGTCDQCDLLPEDAEGESGPPRSEDKQDDSGFAAPKYAVGSQVKVMRESGTFATCEILAADKTEMGPMYAVKFEDGFVQSLMPESDLVV
mmetsp:Transcript_71390/g.149182  ORF Transcript_71390/g.149182 Transcript_71390/m.149182 type:complete len:130 (-) Transcript_71390:231-620(-)|eukprot:CAMPEP_0206454808 /NCGR_PEP_ID=MMETSP0324_2-20121206/21365_1 /ASSEMBLY_ACC=CAM_ASM_000836 /TAXON_ID=2866 /ORGANISM="Crypthecodinium cohnii, Strain Seligo" /LENGTH=129 /DNA_ID=CAMNT_0053925367 /DNA_START=113 /DNA_END=502 /DNA_ORIENTATION=-